MEHMLCPACGEENPANARFCSACAFVLREASRLSASATGSAIDLAEMSSSPASSTSIEALAQPLLIQPGMVVRERYKIEKLLGQGGMGSVFLATDTTINRKIAIKFINPELWQRRAAYLRFIREANVCLDLTHNHIIRVYNLEEWQGQTFLTMEFLDGISLRVLMHHMKKQGAPLDWVRTRSILRQMLDAVDYAHSRGVVHRDLKPGNIMLAREPNAAHRCVVMDFGLARREEEDFEAKTRIGSSLGTPEYMAPEQAVSAAAVDGRADLFSIGAIAYEMLTGRMPKGRLQPPSELVPGLPYGVDEWVFKALEHDPEKRFKSAREMSQQLRQIGKEPQALELVDPDTPTPSSVSDAKILADSKMPPESKLPPDSKPSEAKSTDSSSVLEMGSALDDLMSPDDLFKLPGDDPFAAATGGKRKAKLSFSFQIPEGAKKALLILLGVCVAGWGMMTLWDKFQDWRRMSKRAKAVTTATTGTAAPTRTDIPRENFSETAQGVNLQMVWLPSGKFVMGNSGKPEDVMKQFGLSEMIIADEYPPGVVEIAGFWISTKEITIEDYKAFMTKSEVGPTLANTGPGHPEFKVSGAGASSMPTAAPAGSIPVSFVTYQNAANFCAWLSKTTNKVYRLPTEAQWEYACRAGSSNQFCFGDLPGQIDEYGWVSGNASDAAHPVGMKKANAFGLFDMHGNLWEWCRDYYSENYHSSRALSNPVHSKNTPFRVVRGGSYSVDAQFCRSSVRSKQMPETANAYIGFRVVCLTEAPMEDALLSPQPKQPAAGQTKWQANNAAGGGAGAQKARNPNRRQGQGQKGKNRQPAVQ